MTSALKPLAGLCPDCPQGYFGSKLSRKGLCPMCQFSVSTKMKNPERQFLGPSNARLRSLIRDIVADWRGTGERFGFDPVTRGGPTLRQALLTCAGRVGLTAQGHKTLEKVVADICDGMIEEGWAELSIRGELVES